MPFINWFKRTIDALISEISGKSVKHPIIKRALSFAVDAVLLIASNFALAKFSLAYVGLLITLIYFTLGSSKMVNGQTLGRWLFKLQVLGENGATIGIWRAFVRSILLTIFMWMSPIVLYGMENKSLYWIIIDGELAIFVGMIYFATIKFNRQSLHDLVASTHVVERESTLRTEKNLDALGILGYLVIVGALIYRLMWG